MLRICKHFDVTETIYQNSERPGNILKQNSFFSCFWRYRSVMFKQLPQYTSYKKNSCTFTPRITFQGKKKKQVW